mmetsp:Transcript_29705/g.86568  ORF Transcript_29705/g.86568 Transcript_29705/m.86568 type:complete len:90 (-) Transcript_29705:309-578(-)
MASPRAEQSHPNGMAAQLHPNTSQQSAFQAKRKQAGASNIAHMMMTLPVAQRLTHPPARQARTFASWLGCLTFLQSIFIPSTQSKEEHR